MEFFLYKICTILVQNTRCDAARRAVRLRSKREWLKAPLADEGNVTLHVMKSSCFTSRSWRAIVSGDLPARWIPLDSLQTEKRHWGSP